MAKVRAHQVPLDTALAVKEAKSKRSDGGKQVTAAEWKKIDDAVVHDLVGHRGAPIRSRRVCACVAASRCVGPTATLPQAGCSQRV